MEIQRIEALIQLFPELDASQIANVVAFMELKYEGVLKSSPPDEKEASQGLYSVRFLMYKQGIYAHFPEDAKDSLCRYLDSNPENELVSVGGETYYKGTSKVIDQTRKWYEYEGWRFFYNA